MSELAGAFRLLAGYNRWMNERLYALAGDLPEAEVTADRGAFFGSIFGTLSHLVVADTIWLKRFRQHASGSEILAPMDALELPRVLDARPCVDLPALRARREWLDGIIVAWVDTLDAATLAVPLEYLNLRDDAFRRPLDGTLLHFFNHQTHHRGQITTLFAQMGVDVGVTDLFVRVPELSESALPPPLKKGDDPPCGG
ncbi:MULTISPECIES: DinB family protein [unclassified Pseudoxanthomonas]|uniref:DinB family protein n=1 Tax=unclassified Pseudoxanthomonas TaxID=2645906 RepID=UPI0016115B86|nr:MULTISPECIES: DinB family protein [unclassified Pseudoxanthomonas]MBB3276160.1 putative damage-inducible protein DinB [Pseudoxanthomonas sp. OG2]MBV7472761.1 DinB family protein [Pseudoxanthomonas sp. PXM05]